MVLDAGSGRCLRSFPFTEGGRPTWLTFAADRSLIVVGPDRIASYDPTTSTRNWVSGPLGGVVSSSIRMSVGDVYLATRAGAVVAVSAANGRQRWRTRAFKSEFETVRGMWLDAGNLYAVGDQAVAAFDASDGAVVWTADLPAGVSMRAAALAKRYVVVVGSQPGADGGLGGAQRVAVFFLDRAAGRWSGSPTGEGHCLGEQVALRDVVFQGSTILIREAASLAGWFLGGPGGEGTVPH